MKRSAAILGPTPQFLRWAVEHACPLREFDPEEFARTSLPKTTFGQLRSLRAISDGLCESRVVERFCLHPETKRQNLARPDEARGFEIDEVFSVFGGEEYVSDCCQGCPANAAHQENLNSHNRLVGCYGWLPADANWDLERQTNWEPPDGFKLEDERPSANPQEDFVAAINEAIRTKDVANEFSRIWTTHPPTWNGLWIQSEFSGHGLALLARIVQSVNANEDFANLTDNKHWQQFGNAIERCQASNMKLHTELIPSGFSDGLRWKIFAHCSRCKSTRTLKKPCVDCGFEQSPVVDRYQRVLGMRPFLKLVAVLGEQATSDLLDKYRNEQS